MKRIHFAIFLFLFSALSFNCQKEFSSTNFGTGNTENNLPSPIIATLQGNILDEGGQPAPGVQITVGSKISITNATGYFRIINAALDKNASLIIAEKQGYFKGYRTFNATSGVNQIVIKLMKKTLTGSVDATSGGDIALSNGSKISLPAHGIIKGSNGLPYSGSVNVYARYIDPTASDINQIIPGSFMANDKNNKRVSLVSFGMLAIELESASGEKLQIAKDNTAKLTMSIPSSVQSSAPSTISLWYVDEKTGLWTEEGSAIKSGNNYIGEVKHFTFWNCDYSRPAIILSMNIQNSKGLPLIYTSVKVVDDTSGYAYGYTDSLGEVSGLVPANVGLVLQVLDECGSVIYSQNIGPFTQNTNLGAIKVGNSTASIVKVEGTLFDCNNAPVSHGYAIISFDNIIRYANVNSNGYFSSTFVSCSGITSTCDILGVDSSTQQQGSVVSATIISPVTSVGNISACGTSAVEFIDYNIDGTGYNFSVPGDSIGAFTNNRPTPLFTTYVSGGRQIRFINFDYSHN